MTLTNLDLKGDELEDKIPKEISAISIYGDARGAENATAVISGDFTDFSIVDHLLGLLDREKDDSHHIEESQVQYKGHNITVLAVKDDDHEEFKKGYFVKLNSYTSIVSLQLDEVKNWLNGTYLLSDLNQGSLFSVVVNVETALAHMGMDMTDNTHMMHSQIFKKVSQVSASVSDVDEKLIIEAGLSANDEASATLIEQVVNGLIAMNNLSNANDNNELHALFMQNLSIQKNGKDVLINTYVPMDELEKIDFYQHIKSNSKSVGKVKPLNFD